MRVYLPDGEWRRVPGGDPLAGGRIHELALALDELAVFARQGTEIPLGPAVRHTGELGTVSRATGAWRAA